MASMRDIKRRRGSIQSTQQITKAMKLVSTVKLQRARAGAEKTKSYFDCMYATVGSILARVGGIQHPYLMSHTSGQKAVVVITSNRGLAGGYNSNVVKLITGRTDWAKEDVSIYAIGGKGRDALARNGYAITEDLSDIVEDPTYADAMRLSDRLLDDYRKGKIGEIYMAYTFFRNTVTHVPTLTKLLPVERLPEEAAGAGTPMNFEMDDEEALDLIIPKYVTSLLYGALREAVASENGARMQAMDNATSNAEEMIGDLTLKYNRARQGSITQELTEIIAGAEAIS